MNNNVHYYQVVIITISEVAPVAPLIDYQDYHHFSRHAPTPHPIDCQNEGCVAVAGPTLRPSDDLPLPLSPRYLRRQTMLSPNT